MELTQEEIYLLEKFQSTFKVVAISQVAQSFYVDNQGFVSYENDEVFGETISLDIYYEQECVKTIQQPGDDTSALLNVAKEWKSHYFPLPGDENTTFFENPY